MRRRAFALGLLYEHAALLGARSTEVDEIRLELLMAAAECGHLITYVKQRIP